MHKQNGIAVITLALSTTLLVCSTAGDNRYWNEFSPTSSLFQRYFEENRDELKPIEGIWLVGREEVAIVRDTTYTGYTYVGVRLRVAGVAGMGPTTGRLGQISPGEIFIAFQDSTADASTYIFTCATVLRGEGCRSVPCNGSVVITEANMRAASHVLLAGQCTPDRWMKRYPLR